ncbi:Uncharacterised protein g2052 [Pycnogonum litorale]
MAILAILAIRTAAVKDEHHQVEDKDEDEDEDHDHLRLQHPRLYKFVKLNIDGAQVDDATRKRFKFVLFQFFLERNKIHFN